LPGTDAEEAGERRRLRVVVVDDEPDAVLTLLALLREQGHRAEGFGSGAAALEAIGRLDPDVIISDIAMPATNGWDLAKRIRAVKSQGERPLMIALTGRYTKGTDSVVTQRSGFNFCLTKPYDPDVLLALVESAR
jgi:CheY-like chemotaxis protein